MSEVIETFIEMTEDGKVKRKPKEHASDTKLDLIRDRISDANFDPAEVSRWIAIEIARVAQEMVSGGNDPSQAWKLKAYSEQIKALRELGKQLNDSDLLNKKDSLNFDGPKFSFVLGEIVELFKTAMKDAGIGEDMRVSVMKQYRDLMSQNEVAIRRETQKIDSNKAGK